VCSTHFFFIVNTTKLLKIKQPNHGIFLYRKKAGLR